MCALSTWIVTSILLYINVNCCAIEINTGELTVEFLQCIVLHPLARRLEKPCELFEVASLELKSVV